MKLKGKIILIFIILLCALVIFTNCNKKDMMPEEAFQKFIEEIEKGKLFDMKLTIYYLPPLTLTGTPLSVNNLIKMEFINKYVVSGRKLYEYDELFKQLSNAKLVPVDQGSKINARVYYIFEDSRGKKIFDVAMWGEVNSNYVNGYEFEGEDIFFDILIPFLPEDEVKEFKEEQKHMNKIKQNRSINYESQ